MLCVIGAGLSGLASAYYLRDYAKANMVESANITGGRINTVRPGKYFVDVGAQFFSKEDLEIYPLVTQLKLNKKLKELNLSGFSVFNKNELFKLSESISQPRKETHELVKMYSLFNDLPEETFLDPPEELLKQDFETFYKKNVGKENLWLIEALTRAITFSKPKELSAMYGLITCASFFSKCYGLNGGLSEIIKKLIQNAKSKITKNSKITAIEFENQCVKEIHISNKNGKKKLKIDKKDKLISSVPASNLAKIVSDAELKRLLERIEYHNCTVALLKTKKKLIRDEAGILFPEKEGKISAVFEETKKFSSVTGKGLLLAFMPKALNKENAEEVMIDSLEKILPDIRENIESKQVFIWDNGLPVHNYGLVKVQRKLEELEYENFYLTGDYLGLPSLDACVESAKKASLKIMRGK